MDVSENVCALAYRNTDLDFLFCISSILLPPETLPHLPLANNPGGSVISSRLGLRFVFQEIYQKKEDVSAVALCDMHAAGDDK